MPRRRQAVELPFVGTLDRAEGQLGRQLTVVLRAAIRAGEFKLVRYDTNADTLTGARNQPTSKGKLYNVVADPHEDHDLAAAMPEKVKELQAKWNAWASGSG